MIGFVVVIGTAVINIGFVDFVKKIVVDSALLIVAVGFARIIVVDFVINIVVVVVVVVDLASMIVAESVFVIIVAADSELTFAIVLNAVVIVYN